VRTPTDAIESSMVESETGESLRSELSDLMRRAAARSAERLAVTHHNYMTELSYKAAMERNAIEARRREELGRYGRWEEDIENTVGLWIHRRRLLIGGRIVRFGRWVAGYDFEYRGDDDY